MDIMFKGFNELEKDIEGMQRRIQSIDGTNHVPLPELFPLLSKFT